MNRARTIVAAIAMSSTLAFAAAACGSSGGSDSSKDSATTAASGSDGASSSDAPVALEGKVNAKGTKDISGDGKDVELEMELDDFYFKPTYVKAAPGATVKVSLANEGDKPHTFTLGDGTLDKQLAPGEKATVTVTIPDSGALPFSCDFHGSMGMQGAFYTGDGTASGATSGSDATTTTEKSSSGGGY